MKAGKADGDACRHALESEGRYEKPHVNAVECRRRCPQCCRMWVAQNLEVSVALGTLCRRNSLATTQPFASLR